MSSFTTYTGLIRAANTELVRQIGPTVTDDRQTMTDVIGDSSVAKNVSHTRHSLAPEIGGEHEIAFGSTYGGSNGRAMITIREHTDTYYLDQYGPGHLSIPNGQAVATSRIPQWSPDALNGLLTLLESAEIIALARSLRRIPVHLLWAARRGFAGRKKIASMDYHIWLRNYAADWKRWLQELLGKSPRQVMLSLVGMHLEWKFGWEPLLRDIQAIMSILGTLEDRHRKVLGMRFTNRGRHRDERTQFGTPVVALTDPLGCTNMSVRYHKLTQATWVSGRVVRLKDSAVRFPDLIQLKILRESLGLELNVRTAWEATPLSFIVDWFLPIGNFLESIGNNPVDTGWFELLSSWTSSKLVSTTTMTHVHWDAERANYKRLSGPPYLSYARDMRVSTYTRNVGPIPIDPVVFPQPRIPKGLGKWFSAGEILIQRWSKNPRRLPTGW